MTNKTDANGGDIEALYKALTTIFLTAILLLAFLDVVGNDRLSEALHPGFGFHPASFVLFVLVISVSGKRQGMGLGYFPKPVWDYAARTLTVLLVALTLLEGFEHFTGEAFAWLEPILGAPGLGSYVSFWTLAGLTALHSLDVHCPRNSSRYLGWFSYALYFTVVSLCLHHLSDIFQGYGLQEGHLYFEGLSAISAAWLLAFAAYIFPRTVAYSMLFDPRAPKANTASSAALVLVIGLLLFTEAVYPRPGLSLTLSGALLLVLPVLVAVFRPLEIEARIARGEIRADGSSRNFMPAPRNLDALLSTQTDRGALERGLSSLFFERNDWKRYGVQSGLTFLLAYGAILLSRTAESGIAMIWWANIYLAFNIFIAKDGQYLKTLSVFGAALVAANVLAGNTALASTFLAGVNATEGALVGIMARAVFVVSHTGYSLTMQKSFTVPRLMVVVAFGLVILAFTAVMGSTLISVVFGAGVFDNFGPWFFGSVLGMFSLMPLLVGLILEVGLRYEKLTPKIPYLTPLCLAYALGVFSFYAFGPTNGPFTVPHMVFIVVSLPLLVLPSLVLAGGLIFINSIGYYNLAYARWVGDGPTLQIGFLMMLIPSLITIGFMARHQIARRQIAEQRALDFAPNALITLDDEGRVLSVSKKAQEWFEVDDAALYGKHILGFFVNSKELAEELEEYFQSNPAGTFEAKGIRRLSSGKELVLAGSVRGNLDASLPYSYVLSLLDVTKEHELEKEKAYVTEIVDAFMKDGISYFSVEDENHITLAISEVQATEFVGLPVCEIVGKDTASFAGEDPEVVAERRKIEEEVLARDGKMTANYSRYIKGKPGLRHLRCHIKRIKTKNGTYLKSLVTEDITELERARNATTIFLESQLAAVSIQNEDFSFYFVSDELKKLMGLQSLEDFRDPALGFWERPDIAGTLERRELLKALPTGNVYAPSQPNIYITPSGERLYIKTKYKWIDNPSGTGRLLLFSAENITELEQARATAETYLKSGLSLYLLMNENFEFLFASDAALKAFSVNSIDEIPSSAELFPDLTVEELAAYRNKLLALQGDEVFVNNAATRIKTCSGDVRFVRRSHRWFEGSDGSGRILMTQFEDITELLEQRRAAEELLNAGTNAYTVLDETYKMMRASEEALKLFGAHSVEDLNNYTELFEHPDEQRAHIYSKLAELPTGDVLDYGAPFILNGLDGTQRTVKASSRWFTNPTGNGRLLWTSLDDVTDLVAARSFNEALLDNSHAIILTEDENWKILSCSQAWVDQLGYSRDETVGHDLLEFIHPEDRETSRHFRETKLIRPQGETIKNTLRFLTKAGETHIIEMQSVVEEIEGEWRNIVTLVDFTEIMQSQAKLSYLVEHDELTGLLSRRGMQHRYAVNTREEDKALYVLDIDHFKSVNDSYGHDAGDALLKAYAETLTRLTEDAGCAIRLGGEEFAVIRPWSDWKEAYTFAETLRIALAETKIEVNGRHIQRTASIGYAVLLKDGDLARAMKLADMMQREAKDTGRNKVVGADPETLARLEDRGVFITNKQVQEALERGELIYFVQPIWNTNEKAIEGFEALIRWQKPDGSMVMPGQFVEVLGVVIREPYYRNIKAKLRQDVVAKLGDFPDAYVSFNYKLEQIGYTGAAAAIDAELSASRDHPDRQLVIEISESSMTDRMDRAALLSELEALKEFGYLIALDDFGVESSNIKRLQDYPIDIVKLDKSLVADLELSTKKRSTMTALAIMLMNLKLKIVVEGVETVWQAKTLDIYRLVVQQGYLHARPMRPEEVAPNLAFIGADLTRAERMTEEQLNSLQRLMG